MPCLMPRAESARQPSEVISWERGWPKVPWVDRVGEFDSAEAIQLNIWGDITASPKVLRSGEMVVW